jgi:hypothetical protein
MVQQGITGDARAHMGPTGAAESGPAMTRTSRRSKADSMTPAACVCGSGNHVDWEKKLTMAELFVRSDGKSSGSGDLGNRRKKVN